MLNIEDYILSNKEIELLKLIAKTGFYVTAYKDKFKLSNSTLYSCISKDLICKDKGQFIFTKYLFPYTLTEKGMDVVKNKLLISPYRAKFTQSNHDYALGNIYLSLSNEEKDRWITETGLNKMYPNMSVTDGLFIDNKNKRVGVEVITKNYSETAILSKQAFIDNHCDKSIVIEVE